MVWVLGHGQGRIMVAVRVGLGWGPCMCERGARWCPGILRLALPEQEILNRVTVRVSFAFCSLKIGLGLGLGLGLGTWA